MSNIFTGSVDGGVFVDAVNGQKYRVAAGQAATGTCLMVRPERLGVAPVGTLVPAGSDAVEGTVTDCVYLGSDRSVHVQTTGGDQLIARTPVPRHDDGIRTGARVTVQWQVEDARVLS